LERGFLLQLDELEKKENTMDTTVKSPIEMMYQWESQTPDQVFLRQPSNLEWTEYTWREVADQVRRVAAYLRSLHLEPGSRIGIWSSNSKDWVVVDLAIMLSGHVSVPLYPGQDVESARYIFEHSETSLVFMGGFDQASKADEAVPENNIRVAMLGCAVDCSTSLEEIIANFEPYTASPIPNPEDMFTMLYTSGTTGNPKGVMHMYQTPGYVVPDLVKGMRMDESENRLFSFLPMSHAAERVVVEMTALYGNASISFSEGLTTFADEIRSVQPTFFFAVPRLWVKFKEGVDASIPAEAQAQMTLEQKQAVATHLGFGSARIILTGSAPCSKDVQNWFMDMGIILRDAYGMTENFVHGVGWMHNDTPKAGCIGRPMSESVEVKLSGDGEIMFRSKGLMMGYYREPEKTAEVLVDGWYMTGDAGKFDEEGNLWITGRVSEVFKTSKGKFVRPTRIEDLFGRSDLLGQFCIMGHGLDQPMLLATLTDAGAKMTESELQRTLHQLLEEVNSELPAWEKVGQVFVTPEWLIENGLLTPTMKLKRKQIETKYRPQVEEKLGGEKVNVIA
jgi:long-chain acyl-CoA synthetase